MIRNHNGVDIECSGPYDVLIVYLSLMNVPEELFNEWGIEWWTEVNPSGEWTLDKFFAHKAAEWAYKKGADDELDACCDFLDDAYPDDTWSMATSLRNARRPETLNDIALKMLETIEKDGRYLPEITDTIRKALKENK